MKKGGGILLLIFALSLCLVLGIFIGRNLKEEYAPMPENGTNDYILETQAPMDPRLDINAATKLQLMELPGIGETLADRIIAYRSDNGPFQSTDELMQVEGIGKNKLKQMEGLIRVGG